MSRRVDWRRLTASLPSDSVPECIVLPPCAAAGNLTALYFLTRFWKLPSALYGGGGTPLSLMVRGATGERLVESKTMQVGRWSADWLRTS